MRKILVFVAASLALSGPAIAGETETERAIRLLGRARAAGQEVPRLTGRGEIAGTADTVAERIGATVNYFGESAIEKRARDDLSEMHRQWRDNNIESAGRLYKVEIYDTGHAASDGAVFNPMSERVLPLATGSLHDSVYQAEQLGGNAPLRPGANPARPYEDLKSASYIYVERDGKQTMLTKEAIEKLATYDYERDQIYRQRNTEDAAFGKRQQELAQSRAEAERRADESRQKELARRAEQEKKAHEAQLADRERRDRDMQNERRRKAEDLDEYERRQKSNGGTMTARCTGEGPCRSDTPGMVPRTPRTRVCLSICRDAWSLSQEGKLMGDGLIVKSSPFGGTTLVDNLTGNRAGSLPSSWGIKRSDYGVLISPR